jgi:hypothetical protein
MMLSARYDGIAHVTKKNITVSLQGFLKMKLYIVAGQGHFKCRIGIKGQL